MGVDADSIEIGRTGGAAPVTEIRSHHKSHIETQEALLRERRLDLAEDFLLHFWPGLKGKHFREEELVSKGLPPSEPDRLDFI